MKKAWNVVSAKGQFSQLLVDAQTEPQVVEKRGRAIAVVLSTEAFEALSTSARAGKPAEKLRRFFAASAELRAAGGWDLETARAPRRSPFARAK